MILFSFLTFSCSKGHMGKTDTNTVIKELQKNEIYKMFSGLEIIPRDNENIYVFGIDSLKLYPIVQFSNSEIKISKDNLDYIRDTLKIRRISDYKYITELILKKSQKLISFMKSNDIVWAYGNSSDTSSISLQLKLKNNDYVFFINRDMPRLKKYYSTKYKFIKIIDNNWLVMQDENN